MCPLLAVTERDKDMYVGGWELASHLGYIWNGIVDLESMGFVARTLSTARCPVDSGSELLMSIGDAIQ